MIQDILLVYFITTVAFIIWPFIVLPIYLFTGYTIKEIVKDILPTFYKYTFYAWLYFCSLVIPICLLICGIVKIIFFN